VAGRELTEALRRKSFWVVAGLLLAGSTAAMVLPEVLGDDGPKRYEIATVGGSAQLDAGLSGAVQALGAKLELRTLPDGDLARSAVKDEEVDLAVVAGAPGSGEGTMIVAGSGSDGLVAVVQQALARDAVRGRLEGLGVPGPSVDEVLSAPSALVERLDADSGERRAASGAVSTLLYLLLLSLSVQVATGTAIEKANRISEVLLAIVRPGALLFGKVIGVGLVGLATLACALAPVIIKGAVGGNLPEGLGRALVGSAPWVLIGIVLYLTLGGALGALVERQEEAGSAVMPLTLALVGAYFVAQAAPESPLASVLAYFPLTSPLVMPARIAVGEATPVEMAVSLGLGLAAVVVVIRTGSLVYRQAIVRTGRRLKLRDVLRLAAAGRKVAGAATVRSPA